MTYKETPETPPILDQTLFFPHHRPPADDRRTPAQCNCGRPTSCVMTALFTDATCYLLGEFRFTTGFKTIFSFFRNWKRRSEKKKTAQQGWEEVFEILGKIKEEKLTVFADLFTFRSNSGASLVYPVGITPLNSLMYAGLEEVHKNTKKIHHSQLPRFSRSCEFLRGSIHQRVYKG